MSLAVLRSRALAGMEAAAVSVEVRLANGRPGSKVMTEDEFDHITSFFVPPGPAEGFNVGRHRRVNSGERDGTHLR